MEEPQGTEAARAAAGSDGRAQYARYRAAMYAAASSAFMVEPDDGSLQQLACGAASASADDAVRPCEAALLRHLAGYAAEDALSAADVGTRVRTEYAELFVGPRAPLAPLCESVYVGWPRRLFTQVTRQVRSFYEVAGLAVPARNQVPDDHLSYELQFLSVLCQREAEAACSADAAGEEAARALQRDFLRSHLLAWLPAFAERVQAAWCADYYGAWTQFACQFAQDDISYLQAFSGAQGQGALAPLSNSELIGLRSAIPSCA